MALLGIAQRTISLVREDNPSRPYRSKLPKPLPGTLGFQIRAKRLELHLRPSQFALKVGVLTSTVWAWEANRLRPTEDQNNILKLFFASRQICLHRNC